MKSILTQLSALRSPFCYAAAFPQLHDLNYVLHSVQELHNKRETSILGFEPGKGYGYNQAFGENQCAFFKDDPNFQNPETVKMCDSICGEAVKQQIDEGHMASVGCVAFTPGLDEPPWWTEPGMDATNLGSLLTHIVQFSDSHHSSFLTVEAYPYCLIRSAIHFQFFD